jgi:hypothetical protein
VLVPLAIIAVVAIAQRRPIYDDPHILMQYARNLADGHGWHFNPGVGDDNAVTSPLYVLVLAGGAKVGLPIAGLALAMFVVATWVAAVATGFSLRMVGFRTAALAAACLIASSPVLGAVRGMESALYLACVALSLLAALNCRPVLTGVAFGVLVLVRPDGVIFAAAIAACIFIADPARRLVAREWARLVAAGAAVVVPWLVYASITFDSPIPNTLGAKMAQRDSGFWGDRAVFLRGAWDLWKRAVGPEPLRRGFLLLLAALALAGAIALLRRRTGWQVLVPVAIAAGVLAIAYGVVLDVPPYPWYYAPLAYACLVFAGVAIEWIAGLAPTAPASRALGIGMIAVLVVAGLAQTPRRPNEARRHYVPISAWLRNNTPADARVAAQEIGTIGWESRRPMVDYLGLLDHDAWEHVERGDFEWWVEEYEPDYWVTNARVSERFVDRPLSRRDDFDTLFTPVHSDGVLTVYQRVLPNGPAAPTEVEVTLDGRQATVDWQAPEGEETTGFVVTPYRVGDRGLIEERPRDVACDPCTGAGTADVGPLRAGERYVFRVATVDESGVGRQSAPSNEVTVTP